jgi:hypothetical protein
MWRITRGSGELANGEPLRGRTIRRSLLRIPSVIAVAAVLLAGFVATVPFVISLALSHSDSVARTEWMAEMRERIAAVRDGRSSSFNVYDANGADALVAAVAGLPGLEELGLDRTDVTDVGLRCLTAAANLRKLVIHSCPYVTDTALKHVSAIPALEHLSLWDVAITDEGIADLRYCSTLRRLEVFAGEPQSPCLTPLAATHIGEISQLDVLEIRGNWVTKEALEELHQSLPQTTIIVHGKRKTPSDGDSA